MVRLLLLWLTLCLAAPTARAATLGGDLVTYTLRIGCYQNCADQGLAVGDKARARIGLDASGFAPGGQFGRDSLRSFEVVAGSYAAGLADFAGFHLEGTWGHTLAKVPALGFAASSVVLDNLDFGHVPASRSVQLNVSGAFRLLTTATAGACQGVLCGNIMMSDYATYRPAPAAIPLPGTASLLALAVAGLGLAPLRRRLTRLRSA